MFQCFFSSVLFLYLSVSPILISQVLYFPKPLIPSPSHVSQVLRSSLSHQKLTATFTASKYAACYARSKVQAYPSPLLYPLSPSRSISKPNSESPRPLGQRKPPQSIELKIRPPIYLVYFHYFPYDQKTKTTACYGITTRILFSNNPLLSPLARHDLECSTKFPSCSLPSPTDLRASTPAAPYQPRSTLLLSCYTSLISSIMPGSD
jgi:hypothetical protein